MKVTYWGTRGSVPTPGPETVRYGGNTSCVEVRGEDDTILVLDAGSGIRRLGINWPEHVRRVDILLSHLHMDHIQGLGFFAPLHDRDMEVHVWGPSSTVYSLATRLHRYLSPPLFPMHMRDLPSQPQIHELTSDPFAIGSLQVLAQSVIHPGPTVGYRITNGTATLAYLPDHEPALGARKFPGEVRWISGHQLIADVDLLIHDAQYSLEEYPAHLGWGHSAIPHVVDMASRAGVKRLALFHHDPMHSDDDIDVLAAEATARASNGLVVSPACEGDTIVLGREERARRAASLGALS